MIQRIQTIFLVQSVFLSLALLFIPSGWYETSLGSNSVGLVAHDLNDVHSGLIHNLAIFVNFGALVLGSLIIFLFKRRELQIRLSYLLIALWLVLGILISFLPLLSASSILIYKTNWLSPIICLVGIIAVILAIRGIRKDVHLLKSADRIR